MVTEHKDHRTLGQKTKSFIFPKKYYRHSTIKGELNERFVGKLKKKFKEPKRKSVGLVKVFSKVAPSRKSKMMRNGNQSAQDYLFG